MTFIKNTLISTAIISSFISAPLLAETSCNVNLTGQMSIDKSTIEFFNEDQNKQSLYKIVDNKQLLINGEELDLTSKQQALVTNYSKSIKELVPQVETVVVEGVELAIDGVNLAFNGLLGDGNTLAQTLTKELTNIRDEALTRYSIDKGFTVGGNNDDVEAEEFENKIQSSIERAVTNSMGSILVALGQQMLSSSGDADSFEKRMEKFGETIEAEMANRTDKIEVKAQELCSAITKVDLIEEQLKSSIDELAHINVITVKQSKS